MLRSHGGRLAFPAGHANFLRGLQRFHRRPRKSFAWPAELSQRLCVARRALLALSPPKPRSLWSFIRANIYSPRVLGVSMHTGNTCGGDHNHTHLCAVVCAHPPTTQETIWPKRTTFASPTAIIVACVVGIAVVTTKSICTNAMACVPCVLARGVSKHAYSHAHAWARAGSAVHSGCGFLHRHMFAGESPRHIVFALLCLIDCTCARYERPYIYGRS